MKSINVFLKRLINSSLFLVFATQVPSQEIATENTTEVIGALAKKMFVDMNNRNYDAILDMTHPKVFEIVSKEQMKTLFKSMFEGNDQFSIETTKEIPDYKLSKIFKGEKMIWNMPLRVMIWE